MQYKKKEVRDRILDAGRAEYLEKGYRNGNISDIAKAANVPVGNLYRYFDGKQGLLDEIVKPAYNEIPAIVEDLAAAQNRVSSLEELVILITKNLIELFDRYGKDLIILTDKCATTKYEDFSQKLTLLVSSVVRQSLYLEPTEGDIMMSEIIANAFLDSVFDLLRRGFPRENMEKMMERILVFYFYGIDSRK